MGEKVDRSPLRSEFDCQGWWLIRLPSWKLTRVLSPHLPLSLVDRIKLQGLEFPYTFELTFNNLLFPLTKETWEKDNRAFDDLGISALLDLDGKFSTANENDLLGFGISKPVAIAGSQVRRRGVKVPCIRTRATAFWDINVCVGLGSLVYLIFNSTFASWLFLSLFIFSRSAGTP